MASSKEPMALQLKITLKHTKPPIWRRIVVPDDYTFWDLHVAIQDAMGWKDTHLHEFRITGPLPNQEARIGIPDDEGWSDVQTMPGWQVAVTGHVELSNPKFRYLYDFGDDWEHDVVLEKVLPRDADMRLPVCTAGCRRGPPEDCGGPWGYKDLLNILADPDHRDHKEMLQWAGGPIDPAEFDHRAVFFCDPRERLSFAIGEIPRLLPLPEAASGPQDRVPQALREFLDQPTAPAPDPPKIKSHGAAKPKTLIVNPWHWLDSQGNFPDHDPKLRKRIIRIAQFIQAGGPLQPDHHRETLIQCKRRPAHQPCPGLMWVAKANDTIIAYCPQCDYDEAIIHDWQKTPWAKGPAKPYPPPDNVVPFNPKGLN